MEMERNIYQDSCLGRTQTCSITTYSESVGQVAHFIHRNVSDFVFVYRTPFLLLTSRNSRENSRHITPKAVNPEGKEKFFVFFQ